MQGRTTKPYAKTCVTRKRDANTQLIDPLTSAFNPETSYTSRASIMTDKDEKVLRQTRWDKVKENLLSDANSYPAWRRHFPNAIARYLITGDSEEANKASRPRRDLNPLALDQDRRTLAKEQATWDYYNEEIKSIMYDSLVASSIAESYYDVDLTARANWKKFEKQFLRKWATRAQVSMELEKLHADNPGEGVDALAEAILSTHRRLLESESRIRPS
jgi:hypothetical protein